MNTKVYKFYSDPGHGWLAVKRAELTALNIAGKVSSYSYQRGDTVYLEEDWDMSLFCEAYKGLNGAGPSYDPILTDRLSVIRSYESYAPDQPEEPEVSNFDAPFWHSEPLPGAQEIDLIGATFEIVLLDKEETVTTRFEISPLDKGKVKGRVSKHSQGLRFALPFVKPL